MRKIIILNYIYLSGKKENKEYEAGEEQRQKYGSFWYVYTTKSTYFIITIK